MLLPRRPARWLQHLSPQGLRAGGPLLAAPLLIGATPALAGPTAAAPQPVTASNPAPAGAAAKGTALPALAAIPAPAPAAVAAPGPAAVPQPPAPSAGSAPPRAPRRGAGRGSLEDDRLLPPLDLELQADSQTYDSQLGRYLASGNVTVLLAGGRLQSDRLEFDPQSRQLLASGRVRFQRGQQYLQASRLRFNLLEGRGDMEDVYGVLDLDGTLKDLDLSRRPSAPLPPPQPISCTPDLPPPPDWHPYPWAVTAWGGQMNNTNLGNSVKLQGQFRPEYMMGVGMQRRLLDGGPIAFELDANLLGHVARSQAGGPYNQAVPNADTPAQSFGDGTLGIGVRLWLQPWLSIYAVEGVSLLTQSSNWERTFRENSSNFLNYLAFEVEALVTPQLSAVGRVHHRSGAYGAYSGVREGSNGYLIGLRYRFGSAAPKRRPPTMPPAQGCAGAPPPEQTSPDDLASQLDIVTLGAPPGDPAPSARNPGPASATPPKPEARRGPLWQEARQQERRRAEAIARLDQRVSDVSFQQSLTAERRFGFPSTFSDPDAVNQFGAARPTQLNSLVTEGNRQLVRGTISRWRMQARRMEFTPTTISADRMAFSNDPFTPAQSWLDMENVVATLLASGDTEVRTQSSRIILDDRLPIPITRRTVIRKRQEVANRWVFGNDRTDRDGIYLGYNMPRKVGENGLLTIQPQFMLQRAIDGRTDSYPLPGQSANSPPASQPAKASDLFGLQVKLEKQVFGFDTDATVQVSTFNPDNIANGTRSWGDFSKLVDLPLVGESRWRLFGAYRYRTWNGTLGEQDVYSAYGTSLEQTGVLPNWGKLSSNYLWRTGVGNFQGNDFTTNNLVDSWRFSGIGSINLSYPLWVGQPAPLTASGAYLSSPVPIVPGLWLRANLQGTFAYYGSGSYQNTISLSGGPTLTLGHFVKPFLDYTEVTVTGGGTLRRGGSPFSFDQAVDLSTIGIGLTQQIVGPLVFSGGIGINIDPNSGEYGGVTNSYLEFRWQRRSYEIGVYYSPYDGLGGLRVKLNDFNFSGPGLPYVPYHRADEAGGADNGPSPPLNPGFDPRNPAASPGQNPLSRPF